MYKPIKYHKLASGYEMREDCLFLKKDGVEIPIDSRKIELITNKGKKKLFRVHTLYQYSWHKAPPKLFFSKKSQKSKTTKPRTKKLGKKERPILSELALKNLNMLVEKRRMMEGSMLGQEIDIEKNSIARVLGHNVEKQLLLIRVYSQDWRDGLWFVNLRTGKYTSFNKAKHKPTYGKTINWPEDLI